jgi:transposase
VPLPSEHELERRKILASYGREMKNRTRHINTLQALFVHQGHNKIVKKDLATAKKRQEAEKLLTGLERDEAQWIMNYLALHEQRIKELKDKIQQAAKSDAGMQNLQTIPGVGPVVAYAFTAHIGDGSRFSTGAQVSNFIGFVPRLDYSGTIQRNGPITKHGNGSVRGLLVQAAWSAVRSKTGGALQERYKYKTAGQGASKKKTIVAIGRRLAEIMYSVLSTYEVRQWKGGRDKTTMLVEHALRT